MRGTKKAFMTVAMLVFAIPVAWGESETKLHRRLVETLEQEVVPAYMQGDSVALLRTLSPLVARTDGDSIAGSNEWLAGKNVPSIGELLVEARISLILQGGTSDLPAPHVRETVVLVPELAKSIQATLEEAKSLPILAESLPLPSDFESFDNIFWQAHVFSNKLQTADMFAKYGQSILNIAGKRRLQTLSEADREALKTDFASLDRDIADTYNELDERVIELRLDRLDYAARVLSRPNEFRQRFIAAYVGDLDSFLLERFFQANSDRKFHRERLASPGLSDSIKAQGQQIRKDAGDLVEKSRLLFTGLHWWLRGRYGSGSEGNGMLKSARALTSPEAMFGLYMPTEIPKPTDPSNQSQYAIPELDRRHHYIWQFEYRRISEQSSQDVTTSQHTEYRPDSRTKFARFY